MLLMDAVTVFQSIPGFFPVNDVNLGAIVIVNSLGIAICLYLGVCYATTKYYKHVHLKYGLMCLGLLHYINMPFHATITTGSHRPTQGERISNR